jgi:hypothetical protein
MFYLECMVLLFLMIISFVSSTFMVDI